MSELMEELEEMKNSQLVSKMLFQLKRQTNISEFYMMLKEDSLLDL